MSLNVPPIVDTNPPGPVIGGPYPNDGEPVWRNTPVMAWNRLESRPRQKDFSRVLKAEIHDPLWMLARQWQMGEFKGNDTGSGFLARVQMDYRKISKISRYDETYQDAIDYDGNMPLEPLIESLKYSWSYKERISMSKKWLHFMKLNLIANDFTTYKALFEDGQYGLIIDYEEPDANMNTEDIIEGAKVYSDRKFVSLLTGMAYSGLKIDGGKVFDILVSNTWGSDLQAVITTLTTQDITNLTDARNAFIEWASDIYTYPLLSGGDNWDKSHLEYQFNTYYPDGPTTNPFCVSVPRYHEGNFDWNAFVQTTDPIDAAPSVTTKAIQVIMAQNRFAGMPSSRWWEFENGAVNFGNLDANTSDITKIIMAQFALVYQDDWFTIPYTVPVGSYSQVQGIVVTDVFGVNTFVTKYDINDYNASGFQEMADDWKAWRWMDVSKEHLVTNGVKPADVLIIPPVIKEFLESKPIESVMFVKDEMADMVWGIEKHFYDGFGKGADGNERANALINYMKKLKEDIAVSPPDIDPDPDSKTSYNLNTTNIPENWIPFIPVHLDNSNRDIHFQRAAMPRILDNYDTTLVRPNTEILKYGLPPNYEGYFIYEEEIPRAGAIVETTFQRTRWYNGKTILWIGRRKRTGKGEGNSALAFDKVNELG